MPRVTLRTVAEQVGVSAMTVSNAFSRPDQLSPALRARILTAAADLGYAGPDPAGRSLARGTTGTVGILLTDSLREAFTDEVSTAFLAAITDGLRPTGLALTLLSVAPAPDSGAVPARDVAMDGAIVYSCRPASEASDWLHRRKLPLVYVDQTPAKGISSVNIEDRDGARQAAQHLIDLGHRRVGILTVARGDEEATGDTGSMDGYVAAQRRLGWAEALEVASVEFSIWHQVHCSHDEAYLSATELLKAPDRPTGLLCMSDVMAAAAMRAAADLGLDVPGDVSIVGFDDSPLAGRTRPGLTTVRQDIEVKGRSVAEALTAAIAAHRNGMPVRAKRILLPTELVVRGSTGPPPTPGRT